MAYTGWILKLGKIGDLRLEIELSQPIFIVLGTFLHWDNMIQVSK